MLARIIGVAVIVMGLMVAGCNTVSGVGKDISGAAETVKRSL